jgi:hypothetical protein
MPNGDAAAAAGYLVLTGNEDRRLGYDAINVRGDELAGHTVDGGHDVTKIANLRANTVKSGPTLASNVQADLDFLGSSKANAADVYTTAQTYNRTTIDSAFATRDSNIATAQSTANSAVAGLAGKATAYGGDPNNARFADGPTGDAFARTVGSNRFAVWMSDDGVRVFGRSVSSERYKDCIEPWNPLRLREVEPVSFHYKTEPDEARDFGAIAEQLDDLGLTELVRYDDQGRPDGIHEHRIVWALLALVRDLYTRLPEEKP